MKNTDSENIEYSIDRRTTLKVAGVAGAGMLAGVSFGGTAVADTSGPGPDTPGQVAWIANSGNATVSKVNLDEREEVARYRTEDPDVHRSHTPGGRTDLSLTTKATRGP